MIDLISKNNVFKIWPDYKLPNLKIMWSSKASPKEIEGVFKELYPPSFPVLYPSARAGLSAITELLFSRSDKVWLPPFASHCLINTVGLTSTPTPELTNDVKATLIFHQWGYVHKVNFKGIVIEDSADTLIQPNGHIFPNDGRFELLSLPKIFGCFFGGIILCQKEQDALNLKKIREKRGILKWKHILDKIRGQKSQYSFLKWNNAEPENGFLPSLICNDILNTISSIDRYIDDRKSKLLLINKSPIKGLCDWEETRLPSCLPIALSNSMEEGEYYKSFIRHFSLNKDFSSMQKVLPIGIHFDVSVKQIEDFILDYKKIFF